MSYLEDQDTWRCADCDATTGQEYILCEDCRRRDSLLG